MTAPDRHPDAGAARPPASERDAALLRLLAGGTLPHPKPSAPPRSAQ